MSGSTQWPCRPRWAIQEEVTSPHGEKRGSWASPSRGPTLWAGWGWGLEGCGCLGVRRGVGVGRGVVLVLAQGLTRELDAVQVLLHAVHDGVRYGRLAERPVPVGDRQLAGENRRAQPGAVFDDSNVSAARSGETGLRAKSSRTKTSMRDQAAVRRAKRPSTLAMASFRCFSVQPRWHCIQ